jgi:3-hydroxybutyryl-CoA dehydrogenase
MGVVGCGLMGSGIAEVSARAGLDVVVVESSQDRVDAGQLRLEKSLQRAESRGKLGDASAADVLARINVTSKI